MVGQYRGDRVEIGRVQDAARRILRCIEDEQPRLRRDLGGELRRIKGKVARLRRYSGTGTAPFATSAIRRSESRQG
jgi:hypothetical protein